MSKVLKTVAICIFAELLNIITVKIFYNRLNIPLFFDTIFTVAVVFYCGLIPGLCVAVGYNIINSLIARRKSGFRISPAVTALNLVLIALSAAIIAWEV